MIKNEREGDNHVLSGSVGNNNWVFPHLFIKIYFKFYTINRLIEKIKSLKFINVNEELGVMQFLCKLFRIE